MNQIVVEYETFMHAKPDADGVLVLRGKSGRQTVYVASAGVGKSYWATTAEQARRALIYGAEHE